MSKNQNNTYYAQSGYVYINGLGFVPQTPKQNEKKSLIMCYNITFIAILFLMFLRSFAKKALIKALSLFGVAITQSFLDSTLSDFLFNIIYLGLPILFLLVAFKGQVSFKGMFKKPYPYSMRYSIIFIAGIYALSKILTSLFKSSVSLWNISVIPESYSIPQGTLSFVLFFVLVTIIPAFLEEMLFHGIILRTFRKFGDITAVFVSTFLFVIVNTKIDDMACSVLPGLMLAYMALRSQSIIVPIISSFVVKVLSLAECILCSSGVASSRLLILILYLVLILLATIGFIFHSKKDKSAFIVTSTETNLTNRMKISLFFSNVFIWVIIVISCVNMLRYIEFID